MPEFITKELITEVYHKQQVNDMANDIILWATTIATKGGRVIRRELFCSEPPKQEPPACTVFTISKKSISFENIVLSEGKIPEWKNAEYTYVKISEKKIPDKVPINIELDKACLKQILNNIEFSLSLLGQVENRNAMYNELRKILVRGNAVLTYHKRYDF